MIFSLMIDYYYIGPKNKKVAGKNIINASRFDQLMLQTHKINGSTFKLFSRIQVEDKLQEAHLFF